ncbi:MAG: ion transporter [SAR324 cluster bacterium]|nr:ion transporter [SAR324 cluster bacterium]
MPRKSHEPHPVAPWRQNIFRVIFEMDTPLGRAFDVALIWAILLSLLVVILDSVATIRERFPVLLDGMEWFFTGIFTLEFLARLICVRRPLRYVISPFGVIDVLAILPTYLGLIYGGAQTLLVIRTLRLLRIFRVFKLTQYLSEADVLVAALRGSRRKIMIFLLFVLSLAVIMGSLMYLIEGEEGGFTSIPRGMYWAIVTMTTVGYGDIAPHTAAGQVLAGMLMILGYAIIAVPTGIVSVEMAQAQRDSSQNQDRACHGCGTQGHDADAVYCKYCGAEI